MWEEYDPESLQLTLHVLGDSRSGMFVKTRFEVNILLFEVSYF